MTIEQEYKVLRKIGVHTMDNYTYNLYIFGISKLPELRKDMLKEGIRVTFNKLPQYVNIQITLIL